MKKLFVIDGHSLLYRAYFAMIRNPLYNSQGQNTSAIHGFLNMYMKILKDFRPDAVCVVQDKVRGGFRKEMYAEYKANRDATPDELKSQFPLFDEMLNSMGIKNLSSPQFEGDDIIGSIVNKFKHNKEYEIFVVTGDKDIFQLLDVSDNSRIVLTKKGISETKIYDRNLFSEEFGFTPNKIIDYKALVGDKSDNIPGVPGVGDKTAVKLLNEYGDLDNIYNNVDKLKGALQKKIANNQDQAYLSYKLATISTEFEFDHEIDEFDISEEFPEDFFVFLMKMEFRNLIERYAGMKYKPGKEIEILKTEYNTITTKEDFNILIENIKQSKSVAFDTETSSVDISSLKLVGVSVSFEKGKAFYIPVGHFYLGVEPQLDRKYVVEKLAMAFKNKILIAHNFKFDYLVFKKYGVELECGFDTCIAHYLLESSSNRHGLKNLAKRYFDVRMTEFNEIVAKDETMEQVSIKEASLYACADADITFRLYNKFKDQFDDKLSYELLYKLEMPLIKVLSYMEHEGITIDKDYFKELETDFSAKLNNIRNKIFEIAGEEFNMDSPKQLSYILFEKLGIKPIKKTKTGYSTNAQVLEKLAENDIPIAKEISSYRNLSKLLSTYIIPLQSMTDRNSKIHTSFNQTITSTGRLSSSNPNLQNIPVRTEDGMAIRKGFVAGKNKMFLSLDYSQIELRILAHLSKDQDLIKAFKDEEDIHTITASKIFKTDIENVTKDMRRMAKTVNFGVIYGMNAYGLASRLGISNSEAKEYIDNFFEHLPGVKSYMESTIDFAQKNNYVETMFGRKRDTAGLNKSLFNRVVVNAPIQGAAADIIKKAMISVYNEVILKNDDISMILQIHDELVFEIDDNKDSIRKHCLKIKELMENVVKLDVPLTVDVEYGRNWGDFQEYRLQEND